MAALLKMIKNIFGGSSEVGPKMALINDWHDAPQHNQSLCEDCNPDPW